MHFAFQIQPISAHYTLHHTLELDLLYALIDVVLLHDRYYTDRRACSLSMKQSAPAFGLCAAH
jgi:hypothetical protein